MTTNTRLTSRPYNAESDLAAMQALLRTAPNPFEHYPSAAELPEMLDPTVSDTPNNTLLWEDTDGELAGFVIVSQYRNLHYHFRSGVSTSDLEEELMGWAVERVRLMAIGDTGPVTLDAAARDDDILKKSLLQRHGFMPSDDITVRMSCSLAQPLPQPQLPLGFTLRPLAGEDEVPAYVAAHRAAYGTENMTVELRLSIMRQPHYRPELDLVAVAPDGTLAAFCVCSKDDMENEREGSSEGEIAIVGTHPAFREQGLGRATVLAGMHALQQHGLDTAFLTVAGDNAPAIHVYTTVGFRPDWQIRWFAKQL